MKRDKAKAKRDADRADTEWSDPGSTFGIADRYTQRMMRGLFLTAGNNNRKGPDYTTFTVPQDNSPWHVYARGPNPTAPNQWDLVAVAEGTAESVDLAKQAAERAALAWEDAREVSDEEAKVIGIAEPFCACGRRWSDCDGSRTRCHKTAVSS